MLTIGTIAPEFIMPLTSGGVFSLSGNRGKNLVLFFFVRAFSHG